MSKFYAFLQSYVDSLAMRLEDEDRGAGIAEYALLVAGIAVVALVGINAFGGSVNTFFSGLAAQLGF